MEGEREQQQQQQCRGKWLNCVEVEQEQNPRNNRVMNHAGKHPTQTEDATSPKATKQTKPEHENQNLPKKKIRAQNDFF